MPQTTSTELVGSREVCEELGINRSTLTRWVTSGRIAPAAKFPGPRGAYVFHREAVDRLAEELAAA